MKVSIWAGNCSSNGERNPLDRLVPGLDGIMSISEIFNESAGICLLSDSVADVYRSGMKQFTHYSAILVSGFLVSAAYAGDNELTAEEKAQGWELLFDGKSLDHWKNFNKDAISDKWSVKDGAMYKAPGGGDIVTKKSYKDFEFKCEWNIAPGGNSGIFVRVDNTGKKIYSKSIEIQVLDPASKSKPQHVAGSVYDMIPADAKLAKPAGEWNKVHIICKGKNMKFYLNGTLTGDITIGSEKWTELLNNSKFKTWAGFGLAETGPIGLQEHGKFVSFKNLKIKELK